MFELNTKTKKLHVCYLKVAIKSRLKLKYASSQIVGHLTLREGIALADMAKQYASGGVIVEIGSFLGKSSNFLAGSLSESGHLYCVDTWQNDAMPGGRQDNYSQFELNMKKWEGRYTPLRGNSSDVVKNWSKQVDFLWIDGDHSYEGCLSDIKNWFPYLKNNGWICLHDYANPCGVQQAAQEFLVGKVDKYFFVDSIFFGRKKA